MSNEASHLEALDVERGTGASDEERDKTDLVQRARTILGARLAEVILTHRPDRLEGLNRAAATRSVEELAPLRDAVEIVSALTAVDDLTTIQAWFVGKNGMLGGRAPALVISDDPNAVRRAARRFLAQG
ncbi:MAG: hypothetical protein H0V24_05685 [Chloroflexia bacterium]|nr:hypothetical protein [Chloroflexia bacterium]